MAEPEAKTRGRLGCAVVALALIGAVVGGGLWLGRKEIESKSPCERYLQVASRALANCYSGSKDNPKLLAECEAEVEVTDECFDRVKALSCEVISKNPDAVVDVCRKKR